MVIFPGLLTPLFWERPGNIPPLTRLLVAYLTKAPDAIGASQPQLTAVLGVFQKLIASKANDQYGFQVLTALVNQLPPEAYQQYMGTIWSLLFQRLQVGGCWVMVTAGCKCMVRVICSTLVSWLLTGLVLEQVAWADGSVDDHQPLQSAS